MYIDTSKHKPQGKKIWISLDVWYLEKGGR